MTDECGISTAYTVAELCHEVADQGPLGGTQRETRPAQRVESVAQRLLLCVLHQDARLIGRASWCFGHREPFSQARESCWSADETVERAIIEGSVAAFLGDGALDQDANLFGEPGLGERRPIGLHHI